MNRPCWPVITTIVLSACWRGQVAAPISNVAARPATTPQPCESLRRYLDSIPKDRPFEHCDPFNPDHEYWWCRWDASNDTLNAWKWWAWAAANDLDACVSGGR
jgi:hypothetical protein